MLRLGAWVVVWHILCKRLWPIAYVGRVSVYARFAVMTLWSAPCWCCVCFAGPFVDCVANLSVVPSLAREVLMRWESCLGAQSAEVLRAVYDGQHLT